MLLASTPLHLTGNTPFPLQGPQSISSRFHITTPLQAGMVGPGRRAGRAGAVWHLLA